MWCLQCCSSRQGGHTTGRSEREPHWRDCLISHIQPPVVTGLTECGPLKPLSSSSLAVSKECDILQSKRKEEANPYLLNHLKEDADEESVREVFRIASEKIGYSDK